MTVKDIIKEWLEDHGYDGLYHPRVECGCTINDVLRCGKIRDCFPGYLHLDGEWSVGPRKDGVK